VRKKARLYIELFHGRETPDQKLDNWGEQGPIFGPYRYVHTTYSSDIKMGRPDGDDDDELVIVEDLVYYDKKWYGDWSVFTAPLKSIRESGRHEVFEKEKARWPAEEKRRAAGAVDGISGVIRAAERIAGLLDENDNASTREDFIATARDIIAEETAQPELLEACGVTIDRLEAWGDNARTVLLGCPVEDEGRLENEAKNYRVLCDKLRAAVARAKRGGK